MIRKLVLLLVGSTIACASPQPVPSQSAGAMSQSATIRLQEVAQGLAAPVFLTSPAGDRRLFIVEKPGRIRIIENGQLLPTPFLDITDRVGSTGSEQGLLGLAFHPSYARNGFLFVNYTDKAGDTQIERYRVTADRNSADAASAKRLLSIDQPFANHNGGMVDFGPDGMLYIGMGDGGSRGDPQGHGQNMNSLLGKLLRIDVDRGEPYGIPRGNPFVGRTGVRAEIWASGLRNPWRFSFDRAANQLYVADVGQNTSEEINVVPATTAGVNYGWNRMEASHCFGTEPCDRTGLHVSQYEYPRAGGCSVTGGYVYRGRQIPALVGHYFYADYCQPGIRSMRFTTAGVMNERRWDLPGAAQVASFGQDSDGEMYVLSLGGKVYRIVPG
ncbi:MAG: PQQ-dependent sugar dehydrogenase [Gemmatimonadetes bacterium]|nr:PQQ-dependent sugar dehydrogenase [Gemmatimonadota bacterium]